MNLVVERIAQTLWTMTLPQQNSSAKVQHRNLAASSKGSVSRL